MVPKRDWSRECNSLARLRRTRWRTALAETWRYRGMGTIEGMGTFEAMVRSYDEKL